MSPPHLPHIPIPGTSHQVNLNDITVQMINQAKVMIPIVEQQMPKWYIDSIEIEVGLPPSVTIIIKHNPNAK